jgi:hypothetical protein
MPKVDIFFVYFYKAVYLNLLEIVIPEVKNGLLQLAKFKKKDRNFLTPPSSL